MRVSLDLNKSIEENASIYYDKAKKAKKKLMGTKIAIASAEKKLGTLKERKEEVNVKQAKPKKLKRKLKWYEKFRWFVSSEGFLCVGGRDQTTNDIIVKKHLDKDDLVFHTQIVGSPFFVVKSEGKKIGKKTIEEVAQATASYSRAWRQGFTSTEVYYIKPDQVKKELGLPKGTFMIYGKRSYSQPALKVAIGVKEGEVIGGPVEAVKSQTKDFVVLLPGDLKPSEILKLLRSKFKADPDDVQRFLPSGKYAIEK